MSARRRERSLALIERLHRDRAREAARERGAIEAERTERLSERDAVLATIAESVAPDSASAPYLAAWIRSVGDRADTLTRDAARLRGRSEEAADRSAEAFREAATLCHARDRLAEARAAAEEEALQLALAPFLEKMPGR